MSQTAPVIEHPTEPPTVQVPYQTPDQRAARRFYVGLAVTAGIALLTGAGEIVAKVSSGEIVGGHAVLVALAALLIKDATDALVHYGRAVSDDALPTP